MPRALSSFFEIPSLGPSHTSMSIKLLWAFSQCERRENKSEAMAESFEQTLLPIHTLLSIHFPQLQFYSWSVKSNHNFLFSLLNTVPKRTEATTPAKKNMTKVTTGRPSRVSQRCVESLTIHNTPLCPR